MTQANVTVSISTKDRYFTTLPVCLASIANQEVCPKELLLFDDGEHKDLRTEPLYQSLFCLLNEKQIEWKVIFGNRVGQVANHQKAIEIAKYDLIWRVDDDDMAEPNVLKQLLLNMQDGVGAVGSLIITPSMAIPFSHASGKLSDVFDKANVQWCRFERAMEVEHLHNSFLFRREAAKHGYCHELSPVGHREETIFTYEMVRAGWKLIVDPVAITWHLRSPSGGIRSYTSQQMWDADEQVFRRKLSEWKAGVIDTKLVVLNCGLGDHIVFKMILPELREKHKGKKIVLAVCYPEVFEDDKDVELISIADAISRFGNLDRYDVYAYCVNNNWQGSLIDAFRKVCL